jgi:hypothetical protein
MTTIASHTFTTDEGVELLTTVTVTDEGIIIDFFQGDECVGTIGKTFDEWLDQSI